MNTTPQRVVQFLGSNMWEFKAKFGHWEVWKTPSKFLACYHYERIFVFTDTLKEAMKIAIEMKDQGSV